MKDDGLANQKEQGIEDTEDEYESYLKLVWIPIGW